MIKTVLLTGFWAGNINFLIFVLESKVSACRQCKHYCLLYSLVIMQYNSNSFAIIWSVLYIIILFYIYKIIDQIDCCFLLAFFFLYLKYILVKNVKLQIISYLNVDLIHQRWLCFNFFCVWILWISTNVQNNTS